VKEEISKQDDGLNNWVEKYSSRVEKTTPDIFTKVREIIARSPSVVDLDSEKTPADPFLIEYILVERCQEHIVSVNYCIVTEEKRTKTDINENTIKNAKKIPDLCLYYEIPCMFEMFRKEGCRF
jgi:hypothetical protein